MCLDRFEKAVIDGDVLSIVRFIDDGIMSEVHELIYPPLITAATFGKLASVKTLIEIGKVDVNSVSKNKSTALSYAIFNGYVEIIEYLFEQGADPTILDINGNNCLFVFAIMMGNMDRLSKITLLKRLLSCCDVDVVDVNGFTAFEHYNSHSLNHSDYEIDTLWLNAGVDITNRTKCECFSPKMKI